VYETTIQTPAGSRSAAFAALVQPPSTAIATSEPTKPDVDVMTASLHAHCSGGSLSTAPKQFLARAAVSEPKRRRFNAIMLAGAGAAYLNGGLLGWEFAFCTLLTWVESAPLFVEMRPLPFLTPPSQDADPNVFIPFPVTAANRRRLEQSYSRGGGVVSGMSKLPPLRPCCG
jgi:hypothetical protein